MSGRNNNKLPSNLPQLQNLIKRDPPAYIEEVGRGPGSLGSSRRLPGPSGGGRVWGGSVPEDSFPTTCKPAALRTPQPLKHTLRPVASGLMQPPRGGAEAEEAATQTLFISP